MIFLTSPGKTYSVNSISGCTISADGTTIATIPANVQTTFIAPEEEVIVSDNNAIIVETNKIENITNSSDKVIEIINTLKKYKVTPVGLNDVLQDLISDGTSNTKVIKTSANWYGVTYKEDKPKAGCCHHIVCDPRC